jgi:polar amino acid transport system substrate-binding protein
LDKVADNNLNPKKLQSGRIQLWATGDPAGPFMANLLGIKNIKTVYTFLNGNATIP